MQFKDRREAAQKLVEKLAAFKGAADAIVVALPRGGVVLGKIVADGLGVPLDVVVTRKIGAPGDPEYAIGAVDARGQAVWNPEEQAKAGAEYCEKALLEQTAEAKRRLDKFRGNRPPRDLGGKNVIIIDDGIATGYTVRAAIKAVRADGAKRVIVAVPVAPLDALSVLSSEANEISVLHVPETFQAIGVFYTEFPQVDDETVVRLLR